MDVRASGRQANIGSTSGRVDIRSSIGWTSGQTYGGYEDKHRGEFQGSRQLRPAAELALSSLLPAWAEETRCQAAQAARGVLTATRGASAKVALAKVASPVKETLGTARAKAKGATTRQLGCGDANVEFEKRQRQRKRLELRGQALMLLKGQSTLSRRHSLMDIWHPGRPSPGLQKTHGVGTHTHTHAVVDLFSWCSSVAHWLHGVTHLCCPQCRPE